jgi:hypothetical protein
MSEVIQLHTFKLRMLLPLGGQPTSVRLNWAQKLLPDLSFYQVGVTFEDEYLHSVWIMRAKEEGGFEPMYCDLYVKPE